MTPQRIQLRRTKGWRKPEGAIVVSRPTKWGNPYAVTDCYAVHVRGQHWHVYEQPHHFWLSTAYDKAEAVEFAVQRFGIAVERGQGNVPWPSEIRAALAGHDLACWCPLDQPCHADVLLEIANTS